MNEPSLKGKIVIEYLEKWPKLATKTLARKIYNENKPAFNSIESTRQSVRYYRGQNGQKNRATKQKKFNKFNMEKAEAANNMDIPNPFWIPQEQNEPFEPFNIPPGHYLLLSDIHLPYHDTKSITSALKYASNLEKLDAIILNGDILDCYQLSRYEKDPRKRRFSAELEDCRGFLSMLKKEFDMPIYFKTGNHEERYEAYLRIHAPELLDIDDFRLDVLLRFGETGTQLIADKRPINLNGLSIMHGHEFGRSVFSPVNPARGYYMRAKSNVICGHNHQTSSHTETDMHGKITTTWSTGALCNLRPAYMPFNKWNHGFAVAKGYKDGSFDVDNLRIYDGKIYS